MNNGQCATDLDCPTNLMCVGGTCDLRPTAINGAGKFPCTTTCHCRMDEMCQFDAGTCVTVAPPTLFYFPDAGGNGRSPSTPSGELEQLSARARRPDVIAILWDAGVNQLLNALDLDGGVTLSGGYVDCGPTRWVRDDTKRSFIRGSGAVVRVGGTATAPHEDITVRNLHVDAVSMCFDCGIIHANNAPRFTVENVEGGIYPSSSPENAAWLTRFIGCSDLTVRNLTMLPWGTVTSGRRTAIVRADNVSGLLENLVLLPNAHANWEGLRINGLSGPLTVRNVRIDELIGPSGIEGARLENCGVHPLTVEGMRARWLNHDAVSFVLGVFNCDRLTFRNNVVDGINQSPAVGNGNPSGPGARGMLFTNVSGEIAYNAVWLPNGGDTLNDGVTAYEITGSGTLDFHHNVSDGGTGLWGSWGLSVHDATFPGKIDVHDNALRTNARFLSRAVDLTNVFGSAGLQLRDNELVAQGGAETTAVALSANNSVVALAERNRLEVPVAGFSKGVTTATSTQLELNQNAIRVGPGLNGNPGGGSWGVEVAASAQVSMLGNSIEVQPEPMQPGGGHGLACPSGGVLVLRSNIIGAGGHVSHPVLFPAPPNGCYGSASITRNYFWYSAAGSPSSNDSLLSVMTADAGTFDSNDNLFAPRVSPYVAAGPFELSPGSLCIDKGASGPTRDGGTSALDYLKRPRVVGASADIGCAEKQ